MANEVLNQVPRSSSVGAAALPGARAGWGRGTAAWWMWECAARFASMGVPLIPLAEGARLMRDELCAAGDAEVVIGGAVFGTPPGEPGALKIEAEMVVDRAHWLFLDGHRVRGAVVVPVRWCWMVARAARACRPDLTLAAARGQVLRGIRLSHFDGRAAERFVCARASSPMATRPPLPSSCWRHGSRTTRPSAR